MRKMKYLIIALAMTFMPVLALAQTGYTDNAPFTGSGLGFRLDATLGGAVITDAGGQTLSGQFDIPGHVMDTSKILDVTILQGIFISVNPADLLTWLLDGIPVVGIDGGAGYYDESNGIERNTAITGVSFPSTLKQIGAYAFTYCSGLTGDLSLPDGLTSIGTYAFRNCSGLDGALTLPASLTSIDAHAFENCSGFTGNLTIPDGVTSISMSAFRVCSGLNGTLTLPANLTSIGDETFYDCTFHGALTLPAGLTSIGDWAFTRCNFDGTLTLPDGIVSIGGHAFNDCEGFTGSLTIPDGITSIGENAFSSCSGLRSVTFTGTTPSTIGYDVFAICNGLEYIDMSSSTATGITSLSRASSATSGHVFSSLPMHVMVYLPISLSGMMGTTEEDLTNFVINGTCEYLNIEDNQDYFFPYAFMANNIKYRAKAKSFTGLPTGNFTFATGKSYSLYLPYAFTLPADMGGYAISYYNQHKSGSTTDNTFVFKRQSSFEANMPYAVRVEAGGSASTLPDIINTPTPISASPVGFQHTELATPVPEPNLLPGAPSVEDANGVTWTLCGTSETVDNATAAGWGAYYFGTDSKWYAVSAGSYYDLRQHRVFMVPSLAGAVPAKLFGGFVDEAGNLMDGTTGIGGVEGGNLVETRVYNLGGQYVGKDLNALPNGMYIVNGKKVIKN